MRERIFSSEEIEWLKANYATKSDHACRTYLHISYERLWLIATELGLEKKPIILPKTAPKKTKKVLYMDQSVSINFCIDCIRYREGGFCSKTGKPIGALWQKECFRGEE